MSKDARRTSNNLITYAARVAKNAMDARWQTFRHRAFQESWQFLMFCPTVPKLGNQIRKYFELLNSVPRTVLFSMNEMNISLFLVTSGSVLAQAPQLDGAPSNI